ncbi:MAG: rubrerythrin-like domain-containing protein [Natronomonas sp.]
MHDLEEDPSEPSKYECLECGNVVESDERPSECPECGETGAFRNQSMSLE